MNDLRKTKSGTHVRRRMLFAAAAAAAGWHLRAFAVLPTPAQTAGPFYPPEPPLDHDNDLTRVAGRDGTARGIVSDVVGAVLDANGRPVPGARVEIWQCDANGRYRHPRERGSAPIDANFQGFGATATDAQGRYRFRTIKPVPYPGRAPHIHFAVFPPGTPVLITQMYVADAPENHWDFLLNRLSPDARSRVIVDFRPVSDGVLKAQFDIVLAQSGTPNL